MFNAEFTRKFSLSMHKNMQIKLAEMSFYKNFVATNRGDLYPVIEKSADCVDAVENNSYIVKRGAIKRVFASFFPYATYKVVADGNGAVGFSVNTKTAEAIVTREEDTINFTCGKKTETIKIPANLLAEKNLIVTCRPKNFDIYIEKNGMAVFVKTVTCDEFARSHDYANFSDGFVSLVVSGYAVVSEVKSYLDNGIGIADMRPIRYENGEVMVEEGKVYFTATVRNQAGGYQGIFSWVAGTSQIDYCGAVFFDAGDGLWCGDVASSILYNRKEKQWQLWVCSFAHCHILAYAQFSGDIRFGVSVVDITLMEKASEGENFKVFKGFEGDEDPDFFFDESIGKWRLSVCRIDKKSGNYRYVFFISDQPFAEYECVGCGYIGAETGGSFVKIDGELYFVCGNSFDLKSNYRIYGKDGMSEAKFNFADGGFRGWGTIIPVKKGSRTRYFWLTFDRFNGSDFNWSYGNLYCFERKE